MLLTGWQAILAGGFLLCLAGLLHAHFFWGTRYSPETKCGVEIAKTIMLPGRIVCLLGVFMAFFGIIFELF